MTESRPEPNQNNPNTQEQSAQTEPRKPSLDKLIADAEIRATKKPHGTAPPDGHITHTDKDHPTGINTPTPEH